MNKNELNAVGFRSDNTDGYSDAKLDSLNTELEERLTDIEPFTDLWFDTAKQFNDEVSRR